MRKTLVFTAMPAGATPKTHLAAGPWCFAGQEVLFPDWEVRFAFAPEPLTSPAARERVKQHAWALTAHYLPLMGKHLNLERGVKLPAAFWEMALMPTMLMVSQMLAERWLRIQTLVKHWGNLPLRVPLLPENCEFSFESDYELSKQGFQGYAYNHWLFSRFLEACWPLAWEAEMLPPVREQAVPCVTGPRERLRKWMRKIAYSPPFPHIKGFSPLQALKFSLALLGNRGQADCSVSLSELARQYAVPSIAELQLPLEPGPFFWAAIPRCIMRAVLPKHIKAAPRRRIRVASVAALQDTEYRLRLAAWRAAGHKLVYIQHGGNYGMLRCAATTPLEEYSQHAFITWGWKEQTPLWGNFIPLPHAQTSALFGRHCEAGNMLLFVGNGMELFPHRLDSRPHPMQFLAYRRMKTRFLSALSSEVAAFVSYRPYFDVPAALSDWPWIQERFPKLERCSGRLEASMLSCRLMVLDHHGTTLNLAFAANTPLVLYWDPCAWDLCPEGESLLALLHGAGIWYPTPEEAAAAVERIWPDVRDYWNSPRIQAARLRWCEHFALSAGADFDEQWIRALRTL
ncbi:MAG: LIC12162 family protein [Betaproteobacteria bacterium]|nr:LIC12162 family protein [Betaproteobacteria bacterium]